MVFITREGKIVHLPARRRAIREASVAVWCCRLPQGMFR